MSKIVPHLKEPDAVAHTCNLSYLGDLEDRGSRLAQVKN
jgi:hypothetical protein